MRKLVGWAIVGATCLSGCSYYPVPPDPIRILTSPAEVSTCRRLGSVGVTRTDGTAPFSYGDVTVAVPTNSLTSHDARTLAARQIGGNTFAVRLNLMRDAALNLGASDLLLSRRIYRDWSFVEGIAYRCSR